MFNSCTTPTRNRGRRTKKQKKTKKTHPAIWKLNTSFRPTGKKKRHEYWKSGSDDSKVEWTQCECTFLHPTKKESNPPGHRNCQFISLLRSCGWFRLKTNKLKKKLVKTAKSYPALDTDMFESCISVIKPWRLYVHNRVLSFIQPFCLNYISFQFAQHRPNGSIVETFTDCCYVNI